MIRSLSFVAVMIASAAAHADECRLGKTELRAEDGRAFKVTAAGKGTSTVDGAALGSFVMKGTLEGRPYVVETQKMQGSSATNVSYAGAAQGAFGKPKWLAPAAGLAYEDGDDFRVYGGPLDGAWTFACR